MILFCINPTPYNDYDILAIGKLEELKKFNKNKEYHLIRNSKKYGISLLVIDTCDTMKEAVNLVKIYQTDCMK